MYTLISFLEMFCISMLIYTILDIYDLIYNVFLLFLPFYIAVELILYIGFLCNVPVTLLILINIIIDS